MDYFITIRLQVKPMGAGVFCGRIAIYCHANMDGGFYYFSSSLNYLTVGGHADVLCEGKRLLGAENNFEIS